MPTIGVSKLNFAQVSGAVRAQVCAGALHPAGAAAALRPFITISRQIGTGGDTFAQMLVERLNRIAAARTAAIESPEGPLNVIAPHIWRGFDRELIEQIAADAHLSAHIIESLENASHTWIEEFFAGLGHSDRGNPSELAIFKRVVATVRVLAHAGRVVLVGLGGVFITRNLPGGIHIRVTAPLDFRVHALARQHNLGEVEARARVRTVDENRHAFYRKYWPGQSLAPELFHMVLNAGVMTEEQMVDCILPLLRPHIGG